MSFIGIILIIIALLNLGSARLFNHQLFNKGLSIPIGIVGLALTFATQMFFISDAGTCYTLQSRIGDNKYSISGESGIQNRMFAKITQVDAEIAIKLLTPDQFVNYQNGSRPESSDTYVIEANACTFNDKIPVWFGTSLIVDVNPQADGYTGLVLKSKSERNIVFQRIIPEINEAIANTAKLMGSESYIEGAKIQFSEIMLDQLRLGRYSVVENPEASRKSSTVVDGDSSNVNVTVSPNNRINRYIIEKDETGQKVRTSEGLSAYGFYVRNAVLESEQYSEQFETALADIAEILAQSQQSRQKAELEKRKQVEIEERGKAEILEKKVEEEKKQVSIIITAQTELEASKLLKEKADNDLAAAKVQTLVEREKAAQIKALRNSGIDPVVELEMRLQNNVDVASAMFGGKAYGNVSTLISGEEGNGLDNLNSFLLSKVLKANGN